MFSVYYFYKIIKSYYSNQLYVCTYRLIIMNDICISSSDLYKYEYCIPFASYNKQTRAFCEYYFFSVIFTNIVVMSFDIAVRLLIYLLLHTSIRHLSENINHTP